MFSGGEPMRVDGLLIPDGLLAALEAGRWPRTSEEALQQNLRSLVPEDHIRRLAPEESQLYLYQPPFVTLAHVLRDPTTLALYTRNCALDQIVPEALIEVGDFGLGSDAPVALDYRDGPDEPRVIRLRWAGGGSRNRWVRMAPDFAAFAEALGL